MLFITVCLFLVISIGISSPLNRREDLPEVPSLDVLRQLYPGIFWDDIFTECDDTQRKIIVETTRVAVNDVFQTFPNEDDVFDSAAFNRFFVRQEEPGFDINWHGSFVPEYIDIVNSFKGMSKFITQGGRDKTGQLNRKKQIRYTCKDVNPQKRCGVGTGAQTHNPRIDEGRGWATNFCPIFFAYYRFINDIGKEVHKDVSDLPLLHAREHVLIHELAHADVATGRFEHNHITDVIGLLPGHLASRMYGARVCHQWAWLHSKDAPTSVNRLTSRNADSFAWTYTNAWFAQKFGWNDDGRTLDTTSTDDGPVPAVDEIEDSASEDSLNDNIVYPPPSNCVRLDDPTNVYCTFMGDSEENWLAEKDEPFTSSGGCELSKECHMPIVQNNVPVPDPNCVCTCGGAQTPLTDSRCTGFAPS